MTIFNSHNLENNTFLKYVFPFLLCLIFSVMIFYRIGDRPLLDYDEGIYAQVAKESLINRSPLDFTWKGNPALGRNELWAEKPPLMLWLNQVSYKVFGINEFAARIWVGLFAVATLLLTFIFTLKISKSFLAGLLSMSAYFIASQYLYYAGVLQFDITVAFFILLSLFAFYQSKTNSKYLYLFWVSIALGLLTKNVIGLLPLPIIFIHSLATGEFFYLKKRKFYYGLALCLVLTAPWHIIESLKYGKAFWDQYLFYHVLKRFETGLEGNGKPIWFYVKIIAQNPIFFSIAFVSSLYLCLKSFKHKNYLLPAVALVFIFAFFSLSKTKLPAYILVVYPLFTMAIGITLNDLYLKLASKYKNLGNMLLALGITAFIIFGLRYNFQKLNKVDDAFLNDSKQAGLYLQKNFLELPVYYYSTIGTKPSTIFYSDRVINFLPYPSESKPVEQFLLLSEVSPNFQNATELFTTPSQTVYLVE